MGEHNSSSVSATSVEFVYNMGDKLGSKFKSAISSDDLSYLPSPNLHGLWVFCTDQSPSAGNKNSGDPTTDQFIKEYIAQYIGHLVQHMQLITSNIMDILVQFWTPVTTIGRCFLATSDHPYGVSYNSDELHAYRKLSLDYKIYVDTETEKELCLIGCAFRQKSTKLLPEVQSCFAKECPRLYHAVRCNIWGFAALPMLGPSGLDCIGVVELAFAFRNINPTYKSLTFGAVELKSPVESDHFPSLNVTSGQEPVEKLSIEDIRSLMEEDIDCFQINQVTKYLPRTEGFHHEAGMVHMDSSFDVEDDAITNVNDMVIAEDDAVNNGADAISNGNEVTIVQERNTIVTDSKKEGHIKISQREHKKTETSTSYEVLERHFGMKLKDAAEKLGVSRSKLKRLCRQNGIPRWPSHMGNKANHPFSNQDPHSSELSCDQTLQDGRTATRKATYGDDFTHNADDMIVVEDDATSNGDDAIIVEDDAINNGDDAFIVEKKNTDTTNLKKEGNMKISERENTKTETSISYEDLERHGGMKLKDAAEKLGVSRSKLKCLCRQNGITRWPSHKRNEAYHPLSDQDPKSSEQSPDKTLQDGRIATKKATYGDDLVNNGDDMIVVEDAISNGDDAINNRDDAVIVGKRNTFATHSKKEGLLKISEREHKKTETWISYKVLDQHSGMKLESAAKKLGVSRSKLKRLCRQNGIPRWPSQKRNEANHSLSDQDPPSSEQSPDQTLQDGRTGRTATRKATYGDDFIHNGDDMIVVEDAISNGDDPIIVEDDVTNNGNDAVIMEKRNTVATQLKKEGKMKISESEHTQIETSISYESLERHVGMKLKDAPEKLGVSRSKLKHLCREIGIPRWLSHKRNEVNHRLFDQDPPSFEASTEQILRNGRTATIKASYGDDIIKFQFSFPSRMADLEEEVGKRLKLMFGNFRIKYMDEDGDWILIACDADLENCMRTSISLGMTTIKMVVQPITS